MHLRDLKKIQSKNFSGKSFLSNPCSHKWEKSQKENTLIEKQLFIVGAQKAGTTLLLALFDNHPQIFAFPFELKFHKLFNSVSKNDSSELNVLNDLFLSRSKISLLKKGIFDDKTYRYNMGKLNFEKVDFDLVEMYLHNLPNRSYKRSEYFLELAYSLMYGLNEKREAVKYLVEKSGNHSLDYIEQMFNDSQECKIIHVVRDPKDTLAASKMAINKLDRAIWGDYSLGETLKGIKKSFDIARYYSKDKRYKVIKFEDLLTSTELTMSLLADWLKISYKACFLEPTILGYPWGGNSSSDQIFSAVSKNPIGRAHGVLRQNEIELTELLLRHDCQFFGYSFNKKEMSTAKAIYLKLLEFHIKPKIAFLRKYLRKIRRIHKYPYYFRVLCRNIFSRRYH